MTTDAPSSAKANAAPRPRPLDDAVTSATRPARPRSTGPGSGVDHGQAVVDMVERLRTGVVGHDDVLDPGAEAAGQVDAGLDREGVAGRDRLAVPADQVGVLVLLQPDTVAGAVDEVRPVAALLDDAAGHGVDVLARRAARRGLH